VSGLTFNMHKRHLSLSVTAMYACDPGGGDDGGGDDDDDDDDDDDPDPDPDPYPCANVLNAYMVLQDANNLLRTTQGSTPLKLVGDDGLCVANVLIKGYTGDLECDVTNSQGAIVSQNATQVLTSTCYNALLNNCITLTNCVDVYPNNASTYNFSAINSKLQAISNALSNSPFFPVSNATISLGGSYTTKDVGQYADGSSIGSYIGFQNTSGSMSYTFSPMTSPSIPVADTGINVAFSGTIGTLTGSVTVDGTCDDSQASPNSISGNLSLSTENSALTATASWGIKYCSVNVDGTVTLTGVTLSGNFSYNSNELVLQPQLKISPISLKFNVTGTVLGKTCTPYQIQTSFSIPESYIPEFSSITLISNN